MQYQASIKIEKFSLSICDRQPRLIIFLAQRHCDDYTQALGIRLHSLRFHRAQEQNHTLRASFALSRYVVLSRIIVRGKIVSRNSNKQKIKGGDLEFSNLQLIELERARYLT